MKEENEDERRRGEKKNEKTSTMQLWADEKREDEWTTCSGGVLLAGFRGVEISYNTRDVCVDSFNPLATTIANLSWSVHRYVKLQSVNYVLEQDMRKALLSGFYTFSL